MTRHRNLDRTRHASGPLLAVALTVTATAGWPDAALAWGRNEHRASARAAEARLNPEARAAVRALLEPGETLADASTWADEIRRDRPETGPWHYVNVPISEDRYDDRFCPDSRCVVRKIGDVRKTLADRSAPVAERREALRFLTHFLQDLHQPLHVGHRDDRGGNDLQVRFFDQGSNLHRVWDSGLLEHALDDENALLRALNARIAGDDAATWAVGSARDWATESLLAARRAYQDPVNGATLRTGAKLGQAYETANFPVARKRLAQSAVRLAAVLNETLGLDGSKPVP